MIHAVLKFIRKKRTFTYISYQYSVTFLSGVTHVIHPQKEKRNQTASTHSLK